MNVWKTLRNGQRRCNERCSRIFWSILFTISNKLLRFQNRCKEHFKEEYKFKGDPSFRNNLGRVGIVTKRETGHTRNSRPPFLT